MNTTASFVRNALVVSSLAACALLLYARDRDERSCIALFEKQLAESHAQIADARAAQREAPAATPIVAVRSADPELADAVAARLAVAETERAKAQAAIAANASAPTADQLAAREKVQETLGAAVSRGVLRREDVLAMRRALAGDDAGRAEAARQIAVAMNTGKLVPADGRPAFP